MAKKEMMATETSLKATKAAYESAQKKSTAGAISTFEYLLVKDQMDSAQLQSIIAKYNYIFKVKLLDYYLGVQ